jgi:hypothetical protein
MGLCLALLMVLVFFLVDAETAWRHLRKAAPLPLLWLLVLLSLDRLLMSFKWTLLLKCRGVVLGQIPALKAYYLGSFAGAFLPTTLGADALRVAAVSGNGRPSEIVAASVVMERALGLVASALAALLALALLTELAAQAPRERMVWTLGLTLGLVGVTVAGLLWSLSRQGGRLAQRLEAGLADRGKVAGWLGRLAGAYHQYRAHPGVLGAFLLLSLAEQATPVLANWLAAKALGIDLSLLASAAATPVAITLARLPIWFSAFGVVEGLFVFFLALVGVGATQAFLLGLATNVFSLLTALPGLFFYLSGGLRADRAPGASSGEEGKPDHR